MENLILYGIIFYIFIIFYKVYNNCFKSADILLNKVLFIQQFSNKSTIFSTSSLSIIRADKSGENYVFAVKKDGTLFTGKEIDKLYEISQRLHIHTVVIAVKYPITNTSSIYRKIREYNIDVWDAQKLSALASEQSISENSHKYSVLKTSDTSDDTCKIDKNSFDPIQEESLKTHSLFSGLFDKPDYL